MAKNTLDETRALKVLLAQVRGFCESIQDILHNKDTAEIGRYTSFRDMAHTYNDLAETARVLLRVPSMFYTFNVDEMPSWGDSVWPVQKKILEQVWVSASARGMTSASPMRNGSSRTILDRGYPLFGMPICLILWDLIFTL